MRKALEALWGLWTQSKGQKNNLRVYVNGKAVLPDNVSTGLTSQETCADILIRSQQSRRVTSTKSARDSSVDLIMSPLVSSNVLPLLRSLQSQLQATDISDLAARYKTAHPDTILFEPSICLDPTEHELKEFIDKYIADPQAGASESGWTLREHLIAFALSATFKDCSILIRLPLSGSNGEMWRVSGNPIVKVIDLDMKPMSNLRKWFDLDEVIWQYWRDHPPAESASGAPPEQAADAERKERKSESEVIARPKVFTSPSMIAVEGSSVRAVYAPTPDRSVPHTPMEPDTEELQGYISVLQRRFRPQLQQNQPQLQQNRATQHPMFALGAALPSTTERTTPRATSKELSTEPKAVSETFRQASSLEPDGVALSMSNARQGSEGLDLVDALAITPSTAQFPMEAQSAQKDGVVGSSRDLPIEEETQTSSEKSVDEAKPFDVDQHAAKTEAVAPGSVIVEEHTLAEPEAEVPALESHPPHITSRSVSPTEDRRDRSAAPSPSPHPEEIPVQFEEESRTIKLQLLETRANQFPASPPSAVVPPNEEAKVAEETPPSIAHLTSLTAEDVPSEVEHEQHNAAGLATTRKEEGKLHEDDSEAQQSTILSSAGTVAATAVAGVFGAVAGIAAAAAHVASPIKSTDDQEVSERGDTEDHVKPATPVVTKPEISSVKPSDSRREDPAPVLLDPIDKHDECASEPINQEPMERFVQEPVGVHTEDKDPAPQPGTIDTALVPEHESSTVSHTAKGRV